MNGYAVTAVVIFATCFVISTPSRADETSTAEIDYRPIQLEESSAATATFGNESEIEATSETATFASLESTLSTEFSSNETDISASVPSFDTEELFKEIKARAARDLAFQRRPVQVLNCCFDEDPCDIECAEHFVTSVESPGAVSNETVSLMMCRALYELLECADEDDGDLCMEYCRCFSSDPWADAVGGVMSALFLVCMLLTLAVYAWVPRLRNLHGKCLISYLVAVIAAELVAMVSSSFVCGDPNPLVAGAVIYLSLVRYCWVNLLCIDVYCTCRPFQSVRQPPRTSCFSGERRKFLYFSAAAWGGSALVFVPLEAFQVPYAQIVYAGVIFLLLAASCVPLILTLVRIWRTKRQTKKNCLNISKMKLNWVYLTSKLLCLSGAGKLVSVVAYVTLRSTPYYNWLFVMLKLEGPIMLFLFVCNVRVRGLIRQRLTTLEWISTDKSNDNYSNNN